MARFLLVRVAHAVLVVWGVATLVFVVLHLSGDPTLLMVPQGSPLSAITRLRHELGFDQPLSTQYARFVSNLVRGDLGDSLWQERPAMSIIEERLPATAELAGAALAVALVAGLGVGVPAALWRGGWLDRAAMTLALLGQAMPAFWLGLLLIMLFAVRLHWLPPSGAGGWPHLVLPALTLGSLPTATFARMTRAAVLEETGQDYVRTARAKGASRRRVIAAHLARNAAIPIITVVALEIANLLGGAVITESIFAWPGLGRLVLDAIAARDYTVVQAAVFVGAVVFVSTSLVADVLYSVADPRIRLG
ncbi:MAG TPA: ABC transporter permease [bacterium]|nr:ABC transporter permease [bacterium]